MDCEIGPMLTSINTTGKEYNRVLNFNISSDDSFPPAFPFAVEKLFTPLPDPDDPWYNNSTLLVIVIIGGVVLIVSFYFICIAFVYKNKAAVEDMMDSQLDEESQNKKKKLSASPSKKGFSTEQFFLPRISASSSKADFPTLNRHEPASVEN